MIDPPETDAPKSEIAGVLYIGETRARLLAEAGIRTMDDLRAADAAQIGSKTGWPNTTPLPQHFPLPSPTKRCRTIANLSIPPLPAFRKHSHREWLIKN
jgi:hypothetical protein